MVSLRGAGRCRSFSKCSHDEVVVQDPPPLPLPKKTAAGEPSAGSTAKVSLGGLQPERITAVNAIEQVARVNAKKSLLIELHDAHNLFHEICTKAQALVRNNKESTTSEEIVAMADNFMVLVNSLDLEKALGSVQTMQRLSSKVGALGGGEQDRLEGNIILPSGVNPLQEKLHQAVKSMSALHYTVLSMVESCLPANQAWGRSEMNPSFDNKSHSARTVGRALQLSGRAAELGLPIHRPLYQRLAIGVAITSSPLQGGNPPQQLSARSAIESPDPPKLTSSTKKEPVNLILPGQHAPPIATELLGIFDQARSVLGVSSGEHLHQLALELFADPFLVLLKRGQWEGAMGLLKLWNAQFRINGGSIDLLSLIGEKYTLRALEIAEEHLVDGDTNFKSDSGLNECVLDLTNLLQVSVTQILKDRKHEKENLIQLLWHLSLSHEDDDFEGDSDFDEDDDSDTDFEDDLESDDNEDFYKPAPQTFSVESSSSGSNTSTSYVQYSDDGHESTIVEGVSDHELRKAIYMRNGKDWILPDIVPTLEDWNKGEPLAFTTEFERYLGRQMLGEYENEDDE